MSSSDWFHIHSRVALQTVLVTGGTAGIGYEVARAFVESHARVLLLSRKVEIGDTAKTEIKKAVSDQADIHFVECDLGNLKNVKEVGDKIREEEERLDIVCHIHVFSQLRALTRSKDCRRCGHWRKCIRRVF